MCYIAYSSSGVNEMINDTTKVDSEHMSTMHKAMIKSHNFRSCLNCDNWSNDKQECSKFNAKPPADVIVFSCEEWLMQLPF